MARQQSGEDTFAVKVHGFSMRRSGVIIGNAKSHFFRYLEKIRVDTLGT